MRALVVGAGFSGREADVYLALLELGKGTVAEIARKAKINRTTGYDILDHLVNKGLASISGKGPKQEYAIESPERLRKLFEEKLEQDQELLKETDQLLPQLRSMYGKGSRPQVRFYEGKEGLREVYEDTLTSNETIRAYANVDDMHKALPGYFPHYYARRAEKGIAIRCIIPDNPAGRELVSKDSRELRESALVPDDKYHFSPEINIYDNKVMIASWREKLGIVMESAEIAEAMKEIFELAWAEAKRLEGRMGK
jgi:sugar-specific transcriptional regulator TrmB